MAFPTKPQLNYSFRYWSIHHPSTPLPGDEVDTAFKNVINSVSDIIDSLAKIQRQDGRLANQSVHLETLAPDVVGKIVAQVTPDLTNTLAAVAASATSAQNYAAQARAAEATVKASAHHAATSASHARVSETDAETAAKIATSAASAAKASQIDVGNHANHAKQSEAQADLYQNLARHWAEYMPDTIPPNLLAEMKISGDHWSARWWANKAANAFGKLTSLYLGAHPDLNAALAKATPPIAIGAIYYDTTQSKPYVWNGSSWSPFWQPQKAITTSLYYRVTAPQAAFVLGTNDLLGNSFVLDKIDTEPLEVYLNGVRLFPAGDYTIDAKTNTVTLSQRAAINSVVTIDVLTPRTKFANGTVNFRALVDIDLDPVTRAPGRINGVTTSFSLARTDGNPLAIGSAVELLVSVDGVIQHAGVDYNVVGSRITFTSPPQADSKVWALWMEPGGSGSGKGVQPPAAPDDVHVNFYSWNPVTGGEWIDDRGDVHSVLDAAARLKLKDPEELLPGALVYERSTHDLWAYTPKTTPADPTLLTSWSMVMPGHPSDSILRALEYDPSKPNSMAWEDNRDEMETVGAEADLNNRVVLPLSHLAVGKLVYVRATGQLWECLVDGTTGTVTNTSSDWKQLGGAGVTYVGRVGNLPDPTTASIPDGSLFMVNMDLAAKPYHRLYTFDATGTNAAGVVGVYRPASPHTFLKALRGDADPALDGEEGDFLVTLENGHKELKAQDAAGAWQTVYSEDQVKAWIAAGNLFQGTVQDRGHGTVGAIDLNTLPAQSALGITDAGHYYIYVGLAGHVIAGNEIGSGVSAIDGAKLNVGDWILVANTGTPTAPVMKYTHVPGDLLAKARGDNLYGLNAWAAGAYELGSLVVYGGDIYKATQAVLATDVAPGITPTAPAVNPWAKVNISGGVKTVASDANLPAGAANGAVYLVMSSAQAGGKGSLYMWDAPSSKWQALGGGGIPLSLGGGKKLINYGTPIGTVITFAGKVLPPGYLLCDGSAFDGSVYPELMRVLGAATLPDLRNQFVRGANTLAAVSFAKHDATTGMPKNHFTGVTNSAGSHVHSHSDFSTYGAKEGAHEMVFNGGNVHNFSLNTDSAGAHTHTIEVTAGGDAETAPAHVILAMLIKATDCGVHAE